MKPLKIVIVGLGLIGGSMAKALKQNTSHQVLGMDQDEDALLDACSCGAIDGKAGRDDLKTADLVYLCVYPEGALAFAREYGPLLKAGSVLTDACGVKEELCAAMAALPGQYTFVAGHPMAGKERSGFAASDPSIFVGASYILVDTGAPDWAMALVRERAEEMGFGRVVRTTPARHDQMIAFTSQLPHALACAYVMSPRSYRDVSRVANINDALWSRLFLDNQKALTQELDQLIANLSRLRDAVDRRDQEELRSLLRTAAQIKRQVG